MRSRHGSLPHPLAADFFARRAHLADEVKLVEHDPRVAEVFLHAFELGRTHVNGHLPDRRGMPVGLVQLPGKTFPRAGVLALHDQQHSLGLQVHECRRVIGSLFAVHLAGAHPHHVLPAPIRPRRVQVREDRPPQLLIRLPHISPAWLTGIFRISGRAKA